MMAGNDDDWFVPKLFGFGATPVTWQGWVLTLGMVALLMLDMRLIRSVPAKAVIAVALVLAFCVVIARKTRGGWRWRWGSRD